MIAQRVNDDKAAVRRVAVQVVHDCAEWSWECMPDLSELRCAMSAQALEAILILALDSVPTTAFIFHVSALRAFCAYAHGVQFDASTPFCLQHGAQIRLVEACCSDKAVSTRKQAMCSLSALLMRCPSEKRLQVRLHRVL